LGEKSNGTPNGNNNNRNGGTRGTTRDLSNLKCFGCGKNGHYACDCRNNTAKSNAVSSLFIGNIELEETPTIEWEFYGLAKAMNEDEPDQKIRIGKQLRDGMEK
jgi:hypothetical protein